MSYDKIKYLKYKSKYLLLKKNIKVEKILTGGSDLEIADIDENFVSSELNKNKKNLGLATSSIKLDIS